MHEDEQNHQGKDKHQKHHQQWDRQTHEENKRYQGSQDQSRNFPNKEKIHMNEDDQGQGSQRRHFFPTHGNDRSQRREQYGKHPTKTANSPSPLYDYV